VAAPQILSITNASNTSVMLTWRHPPPATLHGPLIGYRVLLYRLDNDARREIHIPAVDENSFLITNLTVFTKYHVSIAADNDFGYSPADSRVIQTAEGRPTSAPKAEVACARLTKTIAIGDLG
jgi:netrin-G3 ligand